MKNMKNTSSSPTDQQSTRSKLWMRRPLSLVVLSSVQAMTITSTYISSRQESKSDSLVRPSPGTFTISRPLRRRSQGMYENGTCSLSRDLRGFKNTEFHLTEMVTSFLFLQWRHQPLGARVIHQGHSRNLRDEKRPKEPR